MSAYIKMMKDFAVKNDLAETIPDKTEMAAYLAIAAKESGFIHNASNKSSSAYGLIQMLRSTYHKPLENLMTGTSQPDVAEKLRERMRELNAITVSVSRQSEHTRQRVLSDPKATMLIARLCFEYYLNEVKRYTRGARFENEVAAIRVMNLFHHDWSEGVRVMRQVNQGIITNAFLDSAVVNSPGKPMRTDDVKMKRFAADSIVARNEYLVFSELG